MSEEILKALTQLFAIISKQDGGVSEVERNFVVTFFEQELDRKTVNEYVNLYDEYAGLKEDPEKEEDEEKKKKKRKKLTSMRDSVRTLALCKRINKTLMQKQKVIVLFKLLEMLAADRKFTPQRMQIIDTVSQVFNIPHDEYKIIESFATASDADTVVDSPDILIFDETKPPEDSKKKFIDSGLLDGEILFVHVNSVELYFTKYTGNDEIFLNGQLVKKNNILLFSHGSVFKTPKGAPLYYSDLVSTFNDSLESNSISFQVENLQFQFPNGHIGLRDVNLQEGPGKLISIMGASGAGKTTLLNVLAGLESPSAGSVKINGFDLHKEKDKLEGVIGYIAQDDLLIEELSVFENLYYNAKLCFKDMSEEVLVARVNAVLESLGLERIKELKVGNVMNKKISGGQRKRLNIALELIREPAILFVDEPTSGLSSRDSENVIDLLKELSLKGKLIFVVIHQPSSDIYKMFDKMVLLDTGGYPIYYGNPVEAITYFKRATNQVGSDNGQCPSCGNVTPELLFNVIEAQVVNEFGEYTNKRKVTPPEWNELYLQTHNIEPIQPVNEPPPNSLSIPSKIKQTWIFTIRDFFAKVSNSQYLLVNLLEAPLLALLLSLIVRYQNVEKYDEYIFRENDNVPAYILIAIIVALFMGLTVSAEEIIKDRKIQKRESFLNLSRMSYLLSKVIILFALSAIQTLTFVIIGNTVLEVSGLYFSYWFMLFAVSCFANLLGLNISASFNSAVTVYVIIPLLLIPQMILSGAIFRFDQLNNAVVEKGKVPLVADLMVSRWAYEGLAVQQYKRNPYGKLFFDIEMEISQNQMRATFWIPKLQEIITRTIAYAEEPNDSTKILIERDWNLIRNELKIAKVDEEFADLEIDKLIEVVDFNTKTAESLKTVLDELRSKFTRRLAQANDNVRDSIINAVNQDPDYEQNVSEMMKLYNNERLELQLKNDIFYTGEKFVEGDNRLIQQTDNVYQLPNLQTHFFDYRAHFYAPQKHFANKFYDTYTFNLIVIWLMTLLLFLTLYYELLAIAINAIGKLPDMFLKLRKKE
ncbi:MAG: ATP-binding cassette domain-containing protein [Bernardetiaceae bacterium]|nr:ATP-binding cassette domain-containing protein [Bernardetiaceae bacterium]